MGKKNYSMILEQTMIVSTDSIELLDESNLSDGKSKIKFKTYLQEANTVNGNKRRYSAPICETIVNRLSPKAKQNTLLSEVDHPLFFSGSENPEMLKRRAAMIELKNCGAKISEISFKNNRISGIMETLSSFQGPDLANLITKDNINIGFSLRALGGFSKGVDGVIEVAMPILPITYDVVSNPSHKNARILEFIPESDMSIFDNTSSIIYEGEELVKLDDSDRVKICEGNCCTTEFLNDIVNEQLIKLFSKGLNFKF